MPGPRVETEGKSVETIEGLAEPDKLHPIQDAFLEHAALQCGICTPGFHHERESTPRSATQIRRNTKFDTGWLEICAAVPVTIKSFKAVLDACLAK